MEDDLRVRVLLDAGSELPDPLGDRLTSLRRRPCRVDLHVGLLHHVAHLPGDTRPKIWRPPLRGSSRNRPRVRQRCRALRLYEKAAANAPARGPIGHGHSESGELLLMNPRDPEATDLAIRSELSVSCIAHRRELSTFLTASCSSSPLAIPPANRS